MNLHMPKGRANKAGLPLGIIIYVGSQKTEKLGLKSLTITRLIFKRKKLKKTKKYLT
jgi:hypothetical protein